MTEVYDDILSDEASKYKGVDMAIIRRLYVYFRPYRPLLFFAVAVLMIGKAIEASIPLLLGRTAETILQPASERAVEGSVLFDNVLAACGQISLLLFFAYILDAAIAMIKNWIGQKAILTMRREVFEHILHLDVGFFDKNAVGKLMTRTVADVDQISQMFSDSVVPMIANLFLTAGILVGIFLVDWAVALTIVGIVPLVIWTSYYFRTKQRAYYDRIRRLLSRMNAFVQEHLWGAVVIRSFGLQDIERARFNRINEAYKKAHIKTIEYVSLFFSSLGLYQSLMLIIVFVSLVLLAPPQTGFRAGVYFTYSLYTLMLFRPISDLAERYNVLQEALSAARQVFDILDRKPQVVELEGGLTLYDVETIVFKNVWFSYGDNGWALRDVSFEIQRGDSCAFVGMTGAGKSTIVNLLSRFYDCQKGQILINGRDIRDYEISSLRRQFGVVLQDLTLFSGTLFDNVTLRDPSVTRADVEMAAEYIGMEGVLNHLPNGWHENLYGQGWQLSQGQAQLVALTRLVAHGRSVVILDEATASVDAATEKVLHHALKKLLKEKTSIVIAHRLSTVRYVDRIWVLHHGRLVEKGTHEELIAKKGFYEKLYRLLKNH